MKIFNKFNFMSAPFKFISLSKKNSIIFFILSIISGLLQTIGLFAFYPVFVELELFELDKFGSKFMEYYNTYFIDLLNIENNLLSIFLFFISTTLISSLINLFIKMRSIRIATRLTKKLRMEYLDCTLNADWNYFVSKKSGEIVNTFINECSKAVAGFVDTINFLSNLVQFVVFFISVFMVSAIVGFYSLIVGIVYVIVFRIWGKKAKIYGVEAVKLLKKISNSVLDGLKNIKTIKIFGYSRNFYNNLNKIVSSTRINDIRLFSTSAYPETLKEPFFALFISIGLYLIITNNILVFSSLITVLALFQRAMSKLSLSYNQFITIKKMEPFYDSYKNSLKFVNSFKQNKIDSKNFEFKNNINFLNVDFYYDNKKILENINLNIPKGSFISIMGKSGSGKTTILDLLLMLLKPKKGQILVDNSDLSLLNPDEWRKKIGYVTQDHYFFNDSVYNNLCLGDNNYNDEEIKKILKISLCDDFLDLNKDLREIKMGESGLKFSVGQKQRLSIARALLRQPQILILDEATAALDANNENMFLNNLKTKFKNEITIIFISHNEKILSYADFSYCIKDYQIYNISEINEK